MPKALEEKKLGDRQLTDTNGGGFAEWSDSDWSYESGDKPKWELNRKVEFMHRSQIRRGTVTEISDTKNGGFINKEFTYTIRVSNTSTFEGVYESMIIGYVQ